MAALSLQNKFSTIKNRKNKRKTEIDDFVFGQKIGVITKLFSCWHDDLSRPFVQGKTAYRSCLQCGARKQFDPETLETYGSFYFPPAVKKVRI